MHEHLFKGFTDELPKLGQGKKPDSGNFLASLFVNKATETGLTGEVPEDVHRAASGEMAQGQDPNQ